MIDQCGATLIVTPDNTTPGSQGRLYLSLPKDLDSFVGKRFKCLGNFGQDKVIMLVQCQDRGLTVTPRRQVWWKNGVRDHGIRENWQVALYLIEHAIIVVVLVRPTGQQPPKLPPYQPRLF